MHPAGPLINMARAPLYGFAQFGSILYTHSKLISETLVILEIFSVQISVFHGKNNKVDFFKLYSISSFYLMLQTKVLEQNLVTAIMS